MNSIILWIYSQLYHNHKHLQIRFIELVEKDEINPESGIHYITNDNEEHFITDFK